MKQEAITRTRIIEAAIHVIGWGIVFGFPFLMMTRSGFNITLENYMRHGCIVPLSYLILFYLNYLFLIPHYLFKGGIRRYLLLNLLLVAVFAWGTHFCQEFIIHLFDTHDVPPPPRRMGPPRWVFVSRDFFSMILTVGLSVAIRLSGRWAQIEAGKREAEKNRAEAERSRTEAELTNLRNQLNPHFLLNTLNNIYALIAFDTDKAQQAVQELSRLLRHVLYENQQQLVPLNREMDFIRNYIELMRIRLASNVTVQTQLDIAADTSTKIAPLIFISLIENAFKHGISPTEASYINIRFEESGELVRCEIRNSYHPKNNTDKSGSGIGLEQVRKRLELTYPEHYTWQHGVDSDHKEYLSILIINTTSTTPNP
ncbi:MAG: histidine kinase [Bacteroides sp.]|nr:histidine kinase [Bacteroides sp.]